MGFLANGTCYLVTYCNLESRSVENVWIWSECMSNQYEVWQQRKQLTSGRIIGAKVSCN